MRPEPVHPPVHPLPAERRGQAQCPGEGQGQATLPPPIALRDFAVPTLTVRSRREQHGVPPGPAPEGPRLHRNLPGKLLRKLPPVRGR